MPCVQKMGLGAYLVGEGQCEITVMYQNYEPKALLEKIGANSDTCNQYILYARLLCFRQNVSFKVYHDDCTMDTQIFYVGLGRTKLSTARTHSPRRHFHLTQGT